MPDGGLQTRSLGAVRAGSAVVLEALRWPTPLGQSLRVWFGRGVEAARVRGPAGGLAPRGAVVAGET